MAIDLKSVLETMKKTYSFKIKIADDIKNKDLSKLDTILELKGMIKRTQPESLPLASAPLDFPRLKGFFGTIYKMDMDFEYPITPSQLTNELCTFLNLDRAFIIVRNADSPIEQMDEDYLNYKDEDYIPQLIEDEIGDEIDVNDYVGDKYNEELVKNLQSKEAKKYQQGYKEVDMTKLSNLNKGKK